MPAERIVNQRDISIVVPAGIDAIDNPHIETARTIFTESVGRNAALPDVDFIFLCFTNRCGSNLVAEAIGSSLRLNVAGEYLNHDTILEISERFGSKDLCTYLHDIATLEAKNGRLVMKVAITQIAMLHKFGLLKRVFNRSRFLMVQRKDLLRQAISLEIAWQNQQWKSTMSATKPDSALVFSADRLRELIDDLENQNDLFMEFFTLNGIRPYVVTYEYFITNPAFYLADIGNWLGIGPLDYIQANISLERQTRAIHDVWRERFLAERR